MKKLIPIVMAVMFIILIGHSFAALITGEDITVGDDINLAWDARDETDLAGYRVYVSDTQATYTYGSQSPDLLTEIPCNGGDTSNLCTTYSFTASQVGTFFFVATAYDLAGNESGPSPNELKRTVVPFNAPPGAPDNFRFDVTP